MANPESLVGHWVHSHEEDLGDLKVFRPTSFEFPPSRGREEFELRPDGSAVVRSPGPVDVPVEGGGTWKLEGETLWLTTDDGERSLRVVDAEPGKLVVSG
jgi:hypothetical protein